MNEEEKAKILFSGAGFYTIFESNECKFDLSAQREYLRKTMYRRIGPRSLEKAGEEMYKYAGTEAEVNYIKNAEGKWIAYRDGKMTNVVVHEHVDAGDFVTGWYRIVTSIKNPDGTINRRARYFKRVGAKK